MLQLTHSRKINDWYALSEHENVHPLIYPVPAVTSATNSDMQPV